MKIRKRKATYPQVMALPRPAHKKPLKPMLPLRALLKLITLPDLWATGFTKREINMDKLPKDTPCLILMNHSSFIDLKIAFHLFGWRPFNIVCTTDTMVGKGRLMRLIGCTPTNKFVMDTTLIRDMKYALQELGSSVLLYPEAGYTFDGTTTTLPDSLGRLLKLLKVPVVMVTTYGAFTRDPLYNMLQLRKVKVSADVEYLLSPEDIAAQSAEELNGVIARAFSFDGFRWQQENKVRVAEKFRADGLHRVLYKCPHCLAEGAMVGKGVTLTCGKCGVGYTLTEYGALQCNDGEGRFTHVPDWFAWQRDCVRRELTEGRYGLDMAVEIGMLVDNKCLYQVGEGRLVHNEEGFRLTGCDGALDYAVGPLVSYSVNADYYWYELGDVISIGDREGLYYCFPKDETVSVTKVRLGAEELYKLKRPLRRRR